MVTKAADLIVGNLAVYGAHMAAVRDYLEEQLEVRGNTFVYCHTITIPSPPLTIPSPSYTPHHTLLPVPIRRHLKTVCSSMAASVQAGEFLTPPTSHCWEPI